MKKDGRYSAASLSVLPTFESPRPEPPEQLPEEGKQVWRATVAAFKSDWFQGCGPLLQCYCQEVVIAHQIAGALSQCNVDAPRFGGVVRLHVAVSANLGLL